MYTVRVATAEEFHASRAQWNALVGAMNYPSIFCTWEWMAAWMDVYAADSEPVILLVRRDEELVGILPLCRSSVALRSGWMTGRVLSFCGSMDLYPDHLDLIGSRDESESCVNAILEFLGRELTDWDVLSLPYLAGDSNLVSQLAPGRHRLSTDLRPVSSARFIALSGDFDRFLLRFDGKFRYNIRSRRKKLFEDHGFRYLVCDPSSHGQALDLLFDLHRLRAERKQIQSTFKDRAILDFHRAVAARMADTPWMEIRLLANDEATIAASYNFGFNNTSFCYQKGIDPAWERYGPGAVMLSELIKEAYSLGRREYNFLQGGEEYKAQWAKARRVLLTATVYNRRVQGALSRIAFHSKSWFKAVGEVLAADSILLWFQ